MNLATKLAVCFAGGTALAAGAIDLWTRTVYRRNLQEMVVASVERSSDLIKGSTRHAMMQNAREDLYFTIRSIGGLPGMGRVRIFNKEGRISFSTDAREIGALVDKRAEACYVCHATNGPLSRPRPQLPRPDRVRFFRQGETRVLGMISPIENEPECANAACHAHPAGQRVLGVLDVQMPLDRVDTALAAFEQRILIADLLTIAFIAALAFALAFRLLQRPVAKLIEGTRRVASGRLDERLPVDSSDELGELAASFNEMTAQLAEARRESQQWAGTLEQRVAEKTAEVERVHRHMAESEKIVSLGKLAASVAHEINNPLAGILTYARLLSRQLAPLADTPNRAATVRERTFVEWQNWLEVIESESRRCGSIVKNLLTFARQLPMEKKENSLDTILDRCLMLVRHQTELQGVELRREQHGLLPRVVCDAAQIQQALLAILINAVEAVAPRSGVITVRAARSAPDKVHLSVSDNGPGIPPEALPHIFEPFFSTKTQGKGTGLGLSIAYGIVEQHGGRIEVESRPEGGATFTIVLPSKPAPAEEPTLCPTVNAEAS